MCEIELGSQCLVDQFEVLCRSLLCLVSSLLSSVVVSVLCWPLRCLVGPPVD